MGGGVGMGRQSRIEERGNEDGEVGLERGKGDRGWGDGLRGRAGAMGMGRQVWMEGRGSDMVKGAAE